MYAQSEEPLFINAAVVDEFFQSTETVIFQNGSCIEEEEIPTSKYWINDVEIIANDITPEEMEALVLAPKLQEWIQKDIDEGELDTYKLEILKVIWFAARPTPNKLGFVLFRSHTRPVSLPPRPTYPAIKSNVVFVRGAAIGLLFLIKCTDTGDVYVLYCNQYRPAVHRRCDEICAGMVDAESHNILGVALQEAEEELHQKVKIEDLHPLGSYYSSQGVMDEEIELFWCVQTKTLKEIHDLKNRQTGKTCEGENIILKVKLLKHFEMDLQIMQDAKAEIAFYRAREQIYQQLVK